MTPVCCCLRNDTQREPHRYYDPNYTPYRYNFNSPPSYVVKNPLDGKEVKVATTHDCSVHGDKRFQRDTRLIVDIRDKLDLPHSDYPLRACPDVEYRDLGFVVIGGRLVHKLDEKRVRQLVKIPNSTEAACESSCQNVFTWIVGLFTGNPHP